MEPLSFFSSHSNHQQGSYSLKDKYNLKPLKRSSDTLAPINLSSYCHGPVLENTFCDAPKRKLKLGPSEFGHASYSSANKNSVEFVDLQQSASHLDTNFVKSFLTNDRLTKQGRDPHQLALIELQMDKYRKAMSRY